MAMKDLQTPRQVNVKTTAIGTTEAGKEAAKIEFPCAYPIRILGEKSDDFLRRVVEITQRHAPELQHDSVTFKESSKATYMSVLVVIEATGEAQLMALHAELKAYSAVKMVI